MNGIDFIPPKKFILNCIKHNTINKYCKNMIIPETYDMINFPDQRSLKYVTGEFNTNPEFSDTLTKNQKEQLSKAKKELFKNIQ